MVYPLQVIFTPAIGVGGCSLSAWQEIGPIRSKVRKCSSYCLNPICLLFSSIPLTRQTYDVGALKLCS